MRIVQRHGEPFFLVMGIVLTLVVLGGFIPSVMMRPGGAGSIPLLLHVHGAVFLAWFLVYCMQASLIGSGNVRLHMRLGPASLILAAAMIVLGVLVIRLAYTNPDFRILGMTVAASLMFPVTDVINFVIAYGLGLANRRNPSAHKRLMLVAGILIMDPAVARLVIVTGLPAPFIPALELLLFIALFTYDLLTRRRPHWASVLGLGLFILALVAKLAIAQQPWWARLAEVLFG